jgi:threonine/homoserine efflux transporter RhtA
MSFALLAFAALGFAGAGAAFAVARLREMQDDERDLGMRGLALILSSFSAICTSAAAGLFSIIAFGAVIGWCSYVFCAQRIGVFSVELFRPRPRAGSRTTL